MTHLFVSHFHVDHIGELASLFFAFKYGMRRVRSEPLTLLGPQGLERVIAGLKQAFGDNLFEPNFPVEVRLLAPGERLEIGPNSHLSVAKTPHSPESLAVRIEAGGATLCYTGDTDYSEDLARFFEEADLVISECSFTERREGVPHLSIRDAARMAEAARARRLVVTHFYFEVDEEALKNAIEKDYSGDVSIGKDGLALDIQPALC
jgi:ribonuclease BN (tRNA processing enzyme)